MNIRHFLKAGHTPSLFSRSPLFRHQLHGLGLPRPREFDVPDFDLTRNTTRPDGRRPLLGGAALRIVLA